jgi:branched-chain amino acid transport system permease protein
MQLSPERRSPNDNNRKPMKFVLYAFIAIVAVTFPQLTKQAYYIRAANYIVLYSILALGLNILSGYCGQLATGHGCYMGIGAYVSAILAVDYGWRFLPGMLVAIVFTGLFGLVTAIILLIRLRGHYLLIVTIAVSQIVRTVVLNWVSLTRGPMGIPEVPPARLFSATFKSSAQYYYIFLILLGLAILVSYLIAKSKFGRALVAIREDEIAARCMGINTTLHKIVAFTISTLFAGVVGSLMAHYNRFVGPDMFSLEEGLLIFQMVIVGGLGSIPGPILGAAILVLIPELFRWVYEYRMLIYGMLMVIMMIFRPSGFLGTIGSSHDISRWGRAIRELIVKSFHK